MSYRYTRRLYTSVTSRAMTTCVPLYRDITLYKITLYRVWFTELWPLAACSVGMYSWDFWVLCYVRRKKWMTSVKPSKSEWYCIGICDALDEWWWVAVKELNNLIPSLFCHRYRHVSPWCHKQCALIFFLLHLSRGRWRRRIFFQRAATWLIIWESSKEELLCIFWVTN